LAVKHFVDEIPPSGGRTYQIVTNGTTSTITDITQYQQEGTGFGSADVNATCVLECNYAKSGTVHQLTTQNATSENVKFFATAAYNREDTFTFNGTAIAAKTMDGAALDTNFFKANTLVECFVRGNALFFMGQSKSIKDDTEGTAYRLGIENGIMYIEED
jgi:hypothetical protein